MDKAHCDKRTNGRHVSGPCNRVAGGPEDGGESFTTTSRPRLRERRGSKGPAESLSPAQRDAEEKPLGADAQQSRGEGLWQEGARGGH